MASESTSEFDSYSADELRELYATDPEKFDILAAEALRRACLGGTPERTRKLQQMQWVIEAQLRKGKNPLQRLQIMERIFYDEVYKPDGLLAKLRAACVECFGALERMGSHTKVKPGLRLVK